MNATTEPRNHPRAELLDKIHAAAMEGRVGVFRDLAEEADKLRLTPEEKLRVLIAKAHIVTVMHQWYDARTTVLPAMLRILDRPAKLSSEVQLYAWTAIARMHLMDAEDKKAALTAARKAVALVDGINGREPRAHAYRALALACEANGELPGYTSAAWEESAVHAPDEVWYRNVRAELGRLALPFGDDRTSYRHLSSAMCVPSESDRFVLAKVLWAIADVCQSDPARARDVLRYVSAHLQCHARGVYFNPALTEIVDSPAKGGNGA